MIGALIWYLNELAGDSAEDNMIGIGMSQRPLVVFCVPARTIPIVLKYFDFVLAKNCSAIVVTKFWPMDINNKFVMPAKTCASLAHSEKL
jgi:hypothetical protein